MFQRKQKLYLVSQSIIMILRIEHENPLKINLLTDFDIVHTELS